MPQKTENHRCHRTRFSPTAAALVLCAGALLPAAAAMAQSGSPIPHQFILRVAAGSDPDRVCGSHHGTIINSDTVQRIYLMETDPNRDDAETETELGGDNEVEGYEQNTVASNPEAVTQSFFLHALQPDYVDQPMPPFLGFPGAQTLSTGAGITIAIIDTGVTPHASIPMLRADGLNIFDGSSNTAEDPASPGHGTMVAGVIALCAPGASILPVRALDATGTGNAFDVARAIRWATAQGVQVINLSLSSPVESSFISEAVLEARQAGIVVVAAVGDSGLNQLDFPAASGEAIAVTATDLSDTVAPFSDFGNYLTLCAPGVNIFGTVPDGGFASASGTSLAAPAVTAAVAVMRSINPTMSVERLIELLRSSAVNIDANNPSLVGMVGAGRLNASGAALAVYYDMDCRADFNRDGQLNADDLADFISAFFAAVPPISADFNADGSINGDDLSDYITAFFNGGC